MRALPGLYAFNHRSKEGIKHPFLPGNTFSDMGFYYLGPVDGHDLRQLEDALIMAREMDCPVLLHVKTKKGKGYPTAEHMAKVREIGPCPEHRKSFLSFLNK